VGQLGHEDSQEIVLTQGLTLAGGLSGIQTPVVVLHLPGQIHQIICGKQRRNIHSLFFFLIQAKMLTLRYANKFTNS
jgi:hypothetical protein